MCVCGWVCVCVCVCVCNYSLRAVSSDPRLEVTGGVLLCYHSRKRRCCIIDAGTHTHTHWESKEIERVIAARLEKMRV